MIDQALSHIIQELNQFLRIRFSLNEEKVLLSALVEQGGTISTQDENKVIATLVDVSEETSMKTVGQMGTKRGSGPELFLNLQVLFSAYFNTLNYAEALRYLSTVIAFFHAKPVFTPANSPGLADAGIDKLTFELYHQDSNTKNNLWSTLGASYMPSALYLVRMIVVQDASIRQDLDKVGAYDLDRSIDS